MIYRKNLNNWTVCYVVGLSSPSKVKKFCFFFPSRRGEGGRVFAVFFAPFPEKGILDFIAHRPIIQVFTVCSGGVKSDQLVKHLKTGLLYNVTRC